jgi:ABC-type antimicrobial peptide transport system permease subunit
VAIVNEAFAKKYWPNESAFGKHLTSFNEDFQIVGVVRDGKYFSLGEDSTPYFYIPLERHYQGSVTFFLRSASNPAALLEPVRREVTTLNAELPVYNLKTMHEQLRLVLLPARLAAVIIAVFAGLALFLSAVGLFAVVSYWVSQRVRDIAIRKAIGATLGNIVKLVVWQGLSLAVIGLGLGLGIGVLLSRLATGLLYGINASNPAPYLMAGLAMLVAVVLATLLPAQKALRIDVVRALRGE